MAYPPDACTLSLGVGFLACFSLVWLLGSPSELAAQATAVATDPQAQPAREPASAAALQPLREVDQLLTTARKALGELDERSALQALARAERLVSGALALPLSAAFYAEVELQIAVAAAQAGNAPLAEASLQRAARFSPRRKLLLGEASPELVARASRVWSEMASAPEGEVPVDVDAPSARVWLDDEDLGPAPALVRAKVGEHVLRIEAEGRLPYGARLEVEAGRRPAQHYSLAKAAAALDPHAPRALSPASSADPPGGSLPGAAAATGMTQPTQVATTPLWRRWYAWAALGLLAVSAGALLAVSATPEPERQLKVVVDPTRLR